MMIIRRAYERGLTKTSWLTSHHTFSFGDYIDPLHRGFEVLRVINEDFVAPSEGFPLHYHENMEIITYMISGVLQHKDTLGNSVKISANEIQRMTAGHGIRHSEFNASDKDPVHLLQIWVLPNERGLEPNYEQMSVPVLTSGSGWVPLISPEKTENTLSIHQDLALYKTTLSPEEKISYTLQENRAGWIQVIRGDLSLEAETLSSGDGVSFYGPMTIDLQSHKDSEILLFDMALRV